MNVWRSMRILGIAIAFAYTCVQPLSLGESSGGTIHWDIFAVFLSFPVAAMLFVIGIQSVNPWSSPTWQYPSWTANPFTMKQPLQVFFDGGLIFVAGGMGTLVNTRLIGGSFVDAVPFVLLGVGTLVGVYACTIVHGRKMTHDAQ